MSSVSLFILFTLLLGPSTLPGQTVSLRGQVTDESGAVIPAAKVTLNGPSGLTKAATTDHAGRYVFTDLLPGEYIVQASAPKLMLREPARITLTSSDQVLNLQLKVVLEEKVTVEESATRVNTESSRNASAVVLRGDNLKALADNPEDLKADLQALAGPSAGPGGGSIFIDGFSGGQLPSQDSIREIRINSNPFSPEYDRLGYGRIEILTKPGTDKFHGSAYYNFADSFWNSRNPYSQQKAPFLLNEYGGSLSGPINGRSFFFLDVRWDAVDNGSVINAITLDPLTLEIINPFTDTPRTPQRRVGVNPRIDYQLNDKNTLIFRYGFTPSDIRDAGLGSFNLVSRGYHTEGTNQWVQITETVVLGKSAVNETRFQYFHSSGETIANTLSPALQVLGSFNGGGAQVGHSFDARDSYEFQNYTSIVRGVHVWKFGIRVRMERDDNTSPSNFGGTYTFGGGTAPVLRAGFGMFYDRFGLSSTLNALRYNGIVQQQYVVTNPDFFPTIPPPALLAGFQAPQIIQQVSSSLRAPYVMQSAVSIERQLPFNTTVALTYANSHRLHMLRSENINAPLPGTYDPNVPGSGVFPLGKPGAVFLMESSGLYNQHQVITNVNARISRMVSLSGSYVSIAR